MRWASQASQFGTPRPNQLLWPALLDQVKRLLQTASAHPICNPSLCAAIHQDTERSSRRFAFPAGDRAKQALSGQRRDFQQQRIFLDNHLAMQQLEGRQGLSWQKRELKWMGTRHGGRMILCLVDGGFVQRQIFCLNCKCIWCLCDITFQLSSGFHISVWHCCCRLHILGLHEDSIVDWLPDFYLCI